MQYLVRRQHAVESILTYQYMRTQIYHNHSPDLTAVKHPRIRPGDDKVDNRLGFMHELNIFQRLPYDLQTGDVILPHPRGPGGRDKSKQLFDCAARRLGSLFRCDMDLREELEVGVFCTTQNILLPLLWQCIVSRQQVVENGKLVSDVCLIRRRASCSKLQDVANIWEKLDRRLVSTIFTAHYTFVRCLADLEEIRCRFCVDIVVCSFWISKYVGEGNEPAAAIPNEVYPTACGAKVEDCTTSRC